MAKIDTSTIEGYADMTAEQKLAALEGLDLPDADYSGYVKKDVFDKKAAEAANYKKQLDGKLSEEEKAKADRDQELMDLRTQVETLTKEKTISSYKAKYLADGYEEALAQSTAEALVSGDFDKVFANQKAFLEAHDKTLKAGLLDQTPNMPGGGGDKKTEDIKLAEELAKRSVGNSKSFSENMKHYL